MFTIARILYYFNPKLYICIETNNSSYGISEILSQLISKMSLTTYMIYKPNNLNIYLLFEIYQW